MEKYYLASLSNSSSSRPDADLRRKVKLVEIQYARRPPTFGVVYFNQEATEQQKLATIQLTCLELTDNNEAKFCVTRRVEFGNQLGAGRRLVDFDTSKAILMEEDGGAGGGRQSSGGGSQAPVNCIALAQDGNLFNVKLTDGSVNGITSGCDLLQRRLNEGQFIQCHLQEPLNQLQEPGAEYYVHLLAEKAYSLHRLSKGKLQLIHKYSILPSEWSFRHFKSLLMMETNFQVVIVELNDSSLRILQQANCLATLDQANQLGPNQRHLISTGGLNDEAILLSWGRSHIIAHSLLISDTTCKLAQAANHSGKLQKDPDRLLPKEPSFELDKCWSMNLNDLDSIRCLNEQEDEEELDTARGCLCLMWSASQLNPDNSMAKYLVVAHKFHLLIYTFEQRPSLPFSVVYDRSFLKVAQPLKDTPLIRANQSNESSPDFIDPRVRPRLVHNFKLIGARPPDALFNAIFLASGGAHFVQARHFAQLGLLVGLTSFGDLLAFRCVSSQVAVQRNSLYQQLVADSIRGSSLLANQMELLQSGNRILKQDIASLESRSIFGQQSGNEQQLDRFLKAELKMRDDVGCLYNLTISLSNLVQVNRIVVLSTANSYILPHASSPLIMSANIDNRITMKDDAPGPILIANISSQDLIAASSTEQGPELKGQSWDEELIYNCAILNLCARQTQQRSSIDLPIFIMDGQCGNLRILYELDNTQGMNLRANPIKSQLISLGSSSRMQTNSSNNHESQAHETMARAHSTTLPIKELMSYQPTDLATLSGNSLMSCQFTGDFSREKMLTWLNGCYHIPADQFSSRFRSAFTHCYMEFDATNDNQATIKSDDRIAIELVKRQVLKRATDDSTRIEISHSIPTTRHLRHLIGLQHTNLSVASRKLSNVTQIINYDNQPNEPGGDRLLERLISEMNFCELPMGHDETAADSLVGSIRDDIKSLNLLRGEHDDKQVESSDEQDRHVEKNVFNDLVCGFIIDALVDFDKLQGLKPASEMMVAMRVKLVDILAGIDKLDKSSFSNAILTQWNEIKRVPINPLI